MKKNYNIGIFDSGVGGVTVLKEILALLPQENIIYYADNNNAPYGEKDRESLQKLCCNIVDFFMKNECKAIVIACNTATAAALKLLQKKYQIPIIGVISAGARIASEIGKNKKINILATPFTVNSNAYIDEFKRLSKDIEVFQEGCAELCPMIEKGWETFQDRNSILKSHLNNLSSEADTLILACTHYPIIKKDIKSFFSGNIVDPAKETALELLSILKGKNLLNRNHTRGEISFYVSGEILPFKKIAEKFLNFKIKSIKTLKN